MAKSILKNIKPSEPVPESGNDKSAMINMAEGILKHLKPSAVKSDATKDAAKAQLLGAASAVQNSAQTFTDRAFDHALF